MRKIKFPQTFSLRLLIVLLVCSPWISILAHSPAAAAPSDEVPLTVYETLLNPEGLPYELNPGVDGSLWLSDNGAGEIRHYSADGSTVVIYSGLGAVSDAHPTSGGAVWFVDQDNARLGRLDPDLLTASVQYWPLPEGGTSGFGTTIDQFGRIWVSDFSQPLLYRYDPGNTQQNVCVFDTSTLAGFGSPYITSDGDHLWFSSIYDNTILRLDPELDPLSLDYELTSWHYASLTWDFEAEDLLSDGAGGVWFSDSSGSLARLDLDQNPANLLRYRIPSGGGKPYMLARQANQIWYSGQQPGTLGMLLPALVMPDVYFPTQSTARISPDCSFVMVSSPQAVTVSTPTEPVWTAVNYPASNPVTGWTLLALGSESFPWGIHAAENQLWAVDNGRGVLLRTDVSAQITACKLQDLDGDPLTEEDRTPLPGWGMTLYREDEVLATGSTGADGCITWSDLAIGREYAVEEEIQAGWVALSPSYYSLGTLSLPGAYSSDFINWNEPRGVYLPLIQRGP